MKKPPNCEGRKRIAFDAKPLRMRLEKGDQRKPLFQRAAAGF